MEIGKYKIQKHETKIVHNLKQIIKTEKKEKKEMTEKEITRHSSHID